MSAINGPSPLPSEHSEFQIDLKENRRSESLEVRCSNLAKHIQQTFDSICLQPIQKAWRIRSVRILTQTIGLACFVGGFVILGSQNRPIPPITIILSVTLSIAGGIM